MYDKFMIHSNGADNPNASFWSNKHGWTNLVCASHFHYWETETFRLPITPGNDARWIPVAHAYDPTLNEINEGDELPLTDFALYHAIEIQGVSVVA